LLVTGTSKETTMALINLDKHQKEHALLQLLQPEQTGDNLSAELAAIGIGQEGFMPRAQISGAEYTGVWTKSGPGASVMVQSPVPGFAARISSNNASSGYVLATRTIQPILLGTKDIITVLVNVLDPSSTRNVRITLANDAGITIKAYIVGYQTWHPGVNAMSFRISDCIMSGGATATTTWNYLQFSVTNPSFAMVNTVDIGPAYVGGAAKVPMVCVGFDSGYNKVYDWAYPAMKANGIVGNVYAMPSSVGVSDRITLDKYKELYANGWSIGLYGNVDNMGAINHTKTGITTAQSVGAGATFSIDGTLASAGTATLSPARIITAQILSGNEGTNGYTIVGENADGNAITEVIIGPTASASPAYTANEYKKVNSITSINATSVAVSFGTAFTGQEYLDQFSLQKAWIDANGFSEGWAHFAYPLGETNNNSIGWLTQAGFKTARTVVSGSTLFIDQLTGVANPLFMSATVTIGDAGTDAGIKTKVDLAIALGLDLFILGHLGGAVSPDQTELNKTIAWLGSYHREGKIKVVSFAEYEKRLGYAP